MAAGGTAAALLSQWVAPCLILTHMPCTSEGKLESRWQGSGERS